MPNDPTFTEGQINQYYGLDDPSAPLKSDKANLSPKLTDVPDRPAPQAAPSGGPIPVPQAQPYQPVDFSQAKANLEAMDKSVQALKPSEPIEPSMFDTIYKTPRLGEGPSKADTQASYANGAGGITRDNPYGPSPGDPGADGIIRENPFGSSVQPAATTLPGAKAQAVAGMLGKIGAPAMARMGAGPPQQMAPLTPMPQTGGPGPMAMSDQRTKKSIQDADREIRSFLDALTERGF
jgi:hypothetical protein